MVVEGVNNEYGEISFMGKICRKYQNCMQLILNKLSLLLSLGGSAHYDVVDGGRGDWSDMQHIKALVNVLDMDAVSKVGVIVIL